MEWCLQGSWGSQLKQHCYVHVSYLYNYLQASIECTLPTGCLFKLQEFPIFYSVSASAAYSTIIAACSFSPSTTQASTVDSS